MNTSGEGRVFSRKDLQDLQVATRREEHEKNVKRIVQEIRTAVLTMAMQGKDQGYFYPVPRVPLHIPHRNSMIVSMYSDIVNCFVWSPKPEEERRRLIDDIISSLQAGFPEVTILYKSERCVETGMELNSGIYLDWS